ncbi:RICIN domain-containing protein [Hamadaea tsunoensis]|uniref:hypothetical protein n=1 Tax=Hamadaea tsunoensis TaxID=53368 RepID=UPI0004055CC6|nr:hypothetical protein [Hamadaea tsunoensis]
MKKLTGLLALLLLATGFTVMLQGPAQADPLPLTFQIRSVPYGKCAGTDVNPPYPMVGRSCDPTSLDQRWVYDPLTQQITNGRLSTLGRCLSFENSDGTGLLKYLQMVACDAADVTQKWSRDGDVLLTVYQYQGQPYLLNNEGGVNFKWYLRRGEGSAYTFPVL